MYGGTSSPQDFSDYNVYKPLVCGLIAFTPTAFLTVPFDNARRAYYADKTWPIELRRNYKSPIQAFFRIPFEEGLPYLFRGYLPIVLNQAAFWTSYANLYIFLKNKFFFMWIYNDLSYDWCKFCFHNIAFAQAFILSYPFYYIREMVDLWPKERGGFCTFQNSYRYCLKFMVQNMDSMYFNFFKNGSHWMTKYGLQYYVALWMADSLGMMSNCNEPYLALENMFFEECESL